ncbi:hypothetical protein SDJN03_00402, partial [Cucurbita argyrosperma subsp. sororia]
MKKTGLCILVAVAMVAVLTGARLGEAVTCNPMDLSSCVAAITSSEAPTPTCCAKLKEQQSCYFTVYPRTPINSPGTVPYVTVPATPTNSSGTVPIVTAPEAPTTPGNVPVITAPEAPTTSPGTVPIVTAPKAPNSPSTIPYVTAPKTPPTPFLHQISLTPATGGTVSPDHISLVIGRRIQ